MKNGIYIAFVFIAGLHATMIAACKPVDPQTESSKNIQLTCANVCDSSCADFRTPEDDASCKSNTGKIELKVTKVDFAQDEGLDNNIDQNWAAYVEKSFPDIHRLSANNTKNAKLSYLPLLVLNGGLINKQHQFKCSTRNGYVYKRFDMYSDIWAPRQTISGNNLCGGKSEVHSAIQALRVWDNDKAMYVWSEDENWGERNISQMPIVADYEKTYRDGQTRPFNVVAVLHASRYSVLEKLQGENACRETRVISSYHVDEYANEISQDLQKRMLVQGGVASTISDRHSAIIQIYLAPDDNPKVDYCADYAKRFQRVLAHEIGHFLITKPHTIDARHLMNAETDCRATTALPFIDITEYNVTTTSSGVSRWVP